MNSYIFPFLWMRGEKEEILREEIAKIYECGIRAVCVEARPHADFCGPLWWRDMDIVLDEARRREMKVWILDDKHFPTGYAAGLIEQKYPERRKWYLEDTTADIFGASRECTLHVSRMLKPVIGYWQIGQPVNEEEQKNNQLVALLATRFVSDCLFDSEVIDLTDQISGEYVTFCLPPGQWRVHAIYRTRTDGGNESYINMLDSVSAHTQIEGVYEAHYQHYPEEFGKTIAGFFSDEPELGNLKEPRDDAKVGLSIPLPWSREMEELLKERWQGDWRSHLAYLFADSEDDVYTAQIRYDYMDCVTRLYEKNFSIPVGNWCREHGVEYIGHVVEDNGSHSRTGHGPGHWFRSMTGQDMAGIDVIGNQMIFGAPVERRRGMGGMEQDGEFFHYILGKLGASAGHLDPKKKGRTMCELFGAYGWNFGVRDMRYLLDQLLVRGVNHLVPHAFSMAEYPDPDCPPHFYARGNNGQFQWFAQLMKYAERMCGMLNGGNHKASVALLYDGEADWAGDHSPMQKVGRVLMQHQIEFDVVSCDMLRNLEQYQGTFDGKTLTINGVSFEALIIPHASYLPACVAEFAGRSKGFPVIFTDGFPNGFLEDGSGQSGMPWDGSDCVRRNQSCICAPQEKLAEQLGNMGLRNITLHPAFDMLTVYHYQKKGQMFLVMNESAEEAYHGVLELPAKDKLYIYDGEQDRYLRIDEDAGRAGHVRVTLEPGQSLLLMEASQLPEGTCGLQGWESFWDQAQACTGQIDISRDWKVKLCRAAEYPAAAKTYLMDTLRPISEENPAFSGIMQYTHSLYLDRVPMKAVLKAEHVYEVMRVWVNGSEVGFRMIPPYQIELTGFFRTGENEIVIEVANTPGRDQANYLSAPFDFQHEAIEPSGMFGKVLLLYK